MIDNALVKIITTEIGVPADRANLEDARALVAIARDAVLAERARRPSLPRPAALAGFFQQSAESGRPLADVVRERNARLVDRLDELD